MLRTLCLCFALSVSLVASDQTDRFDQIVRSRADHKAFMGTVLVAKGDQILFDKAYGLANLEWNVPNTTDAKFRIGSVTKQFTAASILLLEQQGKLRTGDLASKYLSNTPATWSKITLYHLLTHTSGIPNFTNFPEYKDLNRNPITPEKLIALFRDKPLDFEPGSKWSYSNSGYEVLGYIVEKVSGKTYQEFLDDNLFKPLEMHDSGYDSNSRVIPKHASGYVLTPAGLQNADYSDMTMPYAAGGIYSTTHDLLTWERSLFGEKVVNNTELTKMTTPYKEDYGCGLMIHTLNGHKRISHSGGIQGFNSALAYWPEEQLTIVALSNVNGSAPDDILNDLAATVHAEKVTLSNERKEITLTPAQLEPLVGRYELKPGLHVDFMAEGDQLYTQITGQPKFHLSAQSPTSFFLRSPEAEMDFGQDTTGKVNQVTIHQGGRETVAKKISDTVPEPPQHTEIIVPADKLKDYVGTYALAPGFSITVTLDGNQLAAQATAQPKFPIFAEAADKFFYKVVDAQLEFGHDSSGKVDQVTLHQGGRDITGKKQ